MEIASVIKYDGDNSTFIWKHPKENFNTNTQLIVHESQEAIFFMNGQALDTFGPGKYTLTTENIPLIRSIYHFITKDDPFHCEVYFINKSNQMAIKWGTDSKIQYLDPEYGFPIEIGACGEMCLRVNEGRKLLLKLVGTGNTFTREELIKVFRSFLMIKVKPYLSNMIKNQKINIFEIDSHLEAISNELNLLVKDDFEEYGLLLDKFFLTSILKPDGEKNYERFKNLHFRKYADVAEAELKQKLDIIDETTLAQKRIIESQSLAQKRQIEGYTYQEEKSFGVAEKIAANEGVGNFTSTGIGLGMISGIGSTLATTTNSMFNNIQYNETSKQNISRFCVNCGNAITPEMRFCSNCGNEVNKISNNICSNCGNTLNDNDKFCSICGNKRGD